MSRRVPSTYLSIQQLLTLDNRDSGYNLDSSGKAVTSDQAKTQDPKVGIKSEQHIEVLVIRIFRKETFSKLPWQFLVDPRQGTPQPLVVYRGVWRWGGHCGCGGRWSPAETLLIPQVELPTIGTHQKWGLQAWRGCHFKKPFAAYSARAG